MKQISLVILTLMLFTACSNKRQQYFTRLDSKYNLLAIKQTTYTYNGMPIYECKLPMSYKYNAFITSHYIFIDGDTLKYLSIYEDCAEEYKADNYNVVSTAQFDLESYNNCDIHEFPLIDLSLNIGDTLQLSHNHFIMADDKFYDGLIGDTVCRYTRVWGNKEKSTVIFFSKQQGVVGLYDVENNEVSHALGLTYVDTIRASTQELVPSSINLKDIKKLD